MNGQENFNSEIELRSAVWGKFLKKDNEINPIRAKMIELSKDAVRAQLCGQVEEWQKILNELRQLNTIMTIKQMEAQKAYIDIYSTLGEFPIEPHFN